MNLDFLSISVFLDFPVSDGRATVGDLREFVKLLDILEFQDDHVIDDVMISMEYKPKRELIRCGECHNDDVLLLTHECKGHVFQHEPDLKLRLAEMQEELNAMRIYCQDIREAALLVGGVDHTMEAAKIIMELGRQRDMESESQCACPMCGSTQVHHSAGSYFAGCMECKEMWLV